eukprot:6183830-Pleurochrysis_carterae.AAC.5
MPVASYQTVVRALEQMMNTVSSEELGFDKMLTMPAVRSQPHHIASTLASNTHALSLSAGFTHGRQRSCGKRAHKANSR